MSVVYTQDSLPPTEAVLRLLDPGSEVPEGLWRAGVTLPEELRRELARLLAHCLVRDEAARMIGQAHRAMLAPPSTTLGTDAGTPGSGRR